MDDEATIIVTYPTSQCIIQASWNWPFGRKDMEVYGEKGYVISLNNTAMRLRNQVHKTEILKQATLEETGVYQDPFSYFADVIRGKITLRNHDLYALDNNIMVVRILEAARTSASTGKAVSLAR